MIAFRVAIVLGFFSVLGMTTPARADVKVIDPNHYAAIAYSKSTGKYGYSFKQYSRASAERVALDGCKADDARIVGWVNAGYVVLAIGDNKGHGTGWEYGDGASLRKAVHRAVENCKKHSTKVTTVVYVCSSDDGAVVFKSSSSAGITITPEGINLGK